MRKLLFIFLLSLIMLPAYSVAWVQTGDKTYLDKDSITLYVDENNILHKEQKTFWIKSLNDGNENYKKIEKDFNTKLWYIMTKFIVNTNNDTMAIKTIIYYDLKGNVFYDITMHDYSLAWTSIVPSSVGEFWYYFVTHEDDLNNFYEYQQNKKFK